MEQALDVDQFGHHQFYCQNPIEIFRAQEYGGEVNSIAAFLFLLKAQDILWDIGASIGVQSIHSATIVRQVVAFEPDPATNRRLRQNIQLNRLSEKVHVEDCALSDKEGHFDLHTDGLAGNAPTLKSFGRHSSVSKVPVRTIDLMLSAGLPCPTVLKIDIEGAELAALVGAQGLLGSKNAPRLLFIEIHPEFLKGYSASPDDVLRLVRGTGYDILVMRPEHGQYHMVATRQNTA